MGKYATAQVYGDGERPGSTMACRAHLSRERDTIIAVQDENGCLINDLAKIVNLFRDYYAALYTTRNTLDIDAISDYLTHITMPWLTNADREYLIVPLQPAEIHRALKNMAVGKAPGPDALTASFYKTYQGLLIPHLMALYEEMASAKELPPSIIEAFIFMLLKPGKSSLQCSSYRPLSLINVDTNIYVKILADWQHYYLR
ncbi:hypothetical protein NDU88_006858 [Pleurodeles waltl]|uniref:Uncharacterized protein n=1 Tax=Pleurodeles waltl TaxID=8319 RepID=A0AAV7VRV8_PLEWA|nr:hypothetical protein NDU88_006858 [Pleurodeles waltl]